MQKVRKEREKVSESETKRPRAAVERDLEHVTVF